MSEIQTIENIRTLISQGRTKIAAEHLVALTYTRHKEFYEPALMLKSRLETLEKETIEGVLSHSEQSVEQAKILKSLLSLTSSIEATEQPLVGKIENLKNNLWNRRNISISISLVILVGLFSFWRFSNMNFNTVTSTIEPDVFDLEFIMDITDANNFDLNANSIKVSLGDKPMSNPLIQNDKMVFQRIAQKQWDDSLKVEMLNQDYDIEFKKEERKVDKSVWTKTYKIVERKKVFEGYVRFPDGQPAPFADVEIGFQNIVYSAKANAQGKYEIKLPRSAVDKVVKLTIKHKGISRDYPNKSVNETNLKLLKIHF